jgi:hypothetical protein
MPPAAGGEQPAGKGDKASWHERADVSKVDINHFKSLHLQPLTSSHVFAEFAIANGQTDR